MVDRDPLSSLMSDARRLISNSDPDFPIQVFHCRDRQSLHQVHFYQPTLMLVLRGTKAISGQFARNCGQGNLILVSPGNEFPFANVPDDFYMALAIGFQPQDFKPSQIHDQDTSEKLMVVRAPESLLTLIKQLMSFIGQNMPKSVLDSRRKELANMLEELQLDYVLRAPFQETWTTKVTNALLQDLSKDWSLKEMCSLLATSESNLRRRLSSEGSGYRELLEDLRLTAGLGMVQTTHLPINQIALSCGYQSTSRFSERFKKRFRTSPSDLRKAQ